MSQRIGPCVLHNFGPYEHAEFDLSQPGLTGVEGIIHGHPGSLSNGSGKSYLLGGVSWVLFDDPMREKWAKDDLIRIQFERGDDGALEPLMKKGRPVPPPDGCYGIVHIVGGEHELRVERYRKHPEHKNMVRLFVDGVDRTRGRDVMTNEAIIDLLGMDFRTFVNSVAFGARQDVRSFFAATDTDRKQILERILGLEVYSAAEQVARARMREKAKEVEEQERGIEQAATRIEELRQSLAELSNDEELAEAEFELARLRAQLATANRRAAQEEGALAEARAQLDAAQAEDEKAQEKYRRAHAAFVKAQQEHRRERREADRQLAGARRSVEQAEEVARRWDELAGSKCPTCLQTLPKAEGAKLRRAAESQGQAAQRVADDHQCALEAAEAALAALEEPERPEPSRAVSKAQAALSAVRVRLSDLRGTAKAAQASVTALERSHGDAIERRERFQRRLTEQERRHAELSADISGKKIELDALEFWTEAFGRAGIVSYLIESEVPRINRTATRYARRLLGPGARVQLSATRRLSDGSVREQMEVVGEIPGCTTSYAGASTGQKRRLDLPLLLAFREIVGSRAQRSLDQMFADELFDGLDAAGEESVVELLREIANECPVTLVTHSEAIKAACDRIITVEHRDGIARITST